MPSVLHKVTMVTQRAVLLFNFLFFLCRAMTTPNAQGDLSEAEKFLESLELSNEENASGNAEDIMSDLNRDIE